jgi:hypothetical protein
VFFTKNIGESDFFCCPLYNKSMDDKEYYSLMNRSSTWQLQQALKKKSKAPAGAQQKTESPLPGDTSTYASLELRQGSADAEMLMEKK